MKGVEKCLLDAVHKAQGKGCAPGILGACIGGDRATGFAHSKVQLLRTLDDKNPDAELARLSVARVLFLSLPEMQAIRAEFRRLPLFRVRLKAGFLRRLGQFRPGHALESGLFFAECLLGVPAKTRG